jgi:magnesium-transporting ATPase (P-type)
MTKGEPDIMDRPPRDPDENMLADMMPFLIVTGILVTLSALGGFLWEMNAHGYDYGDVIELARYPHGGEATMATVRPGQSPEDIAAANRITVEQLLEFNPNETPQSISAGDEVVVYPAMSDASKYAIEMSRTVALTTIVLFELFLALNCQSDRRSFRQVGFRNKYLLGAVALSVTLQMALLYVPTLRDMFHLGALELDDWGRILLLTAPALFISPRVLVRHHGDADAEEQDQAA